MHPVADNRLLAALSEAELARIQAHLRFASYGLGKLVHEAGAVQKHVFFPVSGIVSLLQVTAKGASAEVAVVGREGVVGLPLFMGDDSSPYRAVVQSEAQGYCLSHAALTKEFHRGEGLQRELLRYTNALIAQMSQTALCNRHHSLEQQLCRWLLLSLDRLPGNELVMTHELIAGMLGVRREGVSECARKLQDGGLIRYSRGHITVLSRSKVEARACECYGVVEKEYARLYDRTH